VKDKLTNDPRYDDHYLLRFLRAREFDLKKTLLMFTEFLNWREEHDANNAIWVCPYLSLENKIRRISTIKGEV
jgi:hypothetical protein